MTPTVLVASSPIVAHTLNATPVVRSMQAAGARVLWYVAPSLMSYAERWVGQDALAMDARLAAAADVKVCGGPLRSLRGVRDLYRDAIVAPVGAHVAALSSVVASPGVDLIVADTLMLAAGVTAARTKVPWASLGDGPLQWPDPQVPPFGSGLPVMGGRAGRHRNRTVKRVTDRLLFESALHELNRVREGLGLWPVADLLTAGVSRQCHLQGCVPSFEHPRQHWPEHVHFVGALGPGPGVAPAVPPKLRRDRRTRPLAVVSQGTRRADPRELVDPAVGVLLHEGFTVLVAGVTPTTPAAEPGTRQTTTPELVVMDRVDYVDAMGQADLFVTNGGYTGVTLALAAGVPVVQCGATEEKADIGRRLQASGAGESIPLVRPPRWLLRRAVRRAVNSPERRRAQRRIAAEFASYQTDQLIRQHLVALIEEGRRG